MELIIEIDLGANDPNGPHGRYNRNGTLFCDLLGKSLRATERKEHADFENLGGNFRHHPELPGMRIAVDVKGRRVRIFDPLKGNPNGEKKLAQFLKFRPPVRFKAVDEDLRSNLEMRQIRRWLVWCWRQTNLDPFHAVLVSGEYPDWVEKCHRAEVHHYLYRDMTKRAALLEDEMNAELDLICEGKGAASTGSK